MSSALLDRALLAAAPVLAHLERLRDLCNARLAAWNVEPLALCVATAVCVLLLQWAWARLGRCASRVRKEGVASMAVGAVISVASWVRRYRPIIVSLHWPVPDLRWFMPLVGLSVWQ
jgi:hypothetical protein